jgi:hypothetical protein
MRPNPARWLPILSVPLTLALLGPLSGCGGKRSLAEDDLDRARKGVQEALDAWKKGGPPPKKGVLSPQVEITDPDWAAGYRLTGYEIKRVEGWEGTNARSWVALSLQSRQGKKVEKEVVYEIRLGEKVVIGRDPFF